MADETTPVETTDVTVDATPVVDAPVEETAPVEAALVIPAVDATPTGYDEASFSYSAASIEAN